MGTSYRVDRVLLCSHTGLGNPPPHPHTKLETWVPVLRHIDPSHCPTELLICTYKKRGHAYFLRECACTSRCKYAARTNRRHSVSASRIVQAVEQLGRHALHAGTFS